MASFTAIGTLPSLNSTHSCFIWRSFTANALDAGERRWHCAVPLAFAGAALLGLAFSLALRQPALAFLSLLLCTALWAPDPILASWPATYLHDAAAATGSASINSVGSIGALVGPILTGFLEERSGLKTAVLVLSGASFAVAVMALCFPNRSAGKTGGEATEEQTGFLGEAVQSDAESGRHDGAVTA